MSDGTKGDVHGDGDGSERLHELMVRATDGITGVRTDPVRLRRARRRRHRQEFAAVAGGMAAVVAVAGFTLRPGASTSAAPGTTALTPPTAPTTPGTSAPPTSPPHTIPIAAAEVYDAVDGTEGADSLAAFLQGTAPWESYQYCTDHPTAEARIKPGTGVIVDLGRSTALRGVDITPAAGTVEIWSADESVTALPAVRPFQPPAGFHKAATLTATDDGHAKVSTTSRFLLVWYTTLPETLPPAAHSFCGGKVTYTGRLDKVVVFGQ